MESGKINTQNMLQLEVVLNAIPGFVSWIDKDLNYCGVNKQLLDFFGSTQNEFIGEKLGSVTPGDNEFLIKQAIKLFNNKDKKVQCEISFEKEGQKYWNLLTLQKYNNDMNALLVSIDITQLKEAQIKTKEDEARAIHNGRLIALGEMVGTIAHEINNPLAVINMSNSILDKQGRDKKLDLARIASVHDMNKTALNKIQAIIKSVKNLVRDGSQDEFVTFSLKEIFEDVLLFIRKKCVSKKITLTFDFPEEDVLLKCVPVQIDQVLLILLNNACDAIEKENKKWIDIKVIPKKDSVQISIIDSGPGIDQQVSSKIFDTFFTTKERGKGSGIGLGLAQKIITSHKGTLSVDNNDKNTKFDLILPY
jgi:PAS domain S-box-containing protein